MELPGQCPASARENRFQNFGFRVWKLSERAFLLAKNKKIMLVRFLTEQILYFLPQLQPKSTFLEKKSRLQKSTARAVVFDISESTARAVDFGG